MTISEEEPNSPSDSVTSNEFGLKTFYVICVDFINSIISGSPFEFLDVLDLPLFDIFDEFQWKVFKILSFIIFVNILLISFFWHIYGSKIVEKFMQPTSSARLIEELKHSIAELKLPKEHSPRI